MSLTSAINQCKDTDVELHQKLNKAVENKSKENSKQAKQLLAITRRWIAFKTLKNIFLSFITIGILPLYYSLTKHLNFIKFPYLNAKNTLNALKDEVKKGDQAADQTVKESPPAFSSTAAEQQERFQKNNHLSKILGGVSPLWIEKTENISYGDPTEKTIHNDGKILSSFKVNYKNGSQSHSNYAIGLSTKNSKKEEILFRTAYRAIQKMVALEYAPEKFAFFI